jgi:hypothetical protein
MAKKSKIPEKLQRWIEARQRHHLSHAQIQMAREMGMNPKSFGKLDNHRQEPWKLPLGQFIEECYCKRFGQLPATVLSIEQCAQRDEKKRAARRQAKAVKRQAKDAGEAPPPQGELPPHGSGGGKSESASTAPVPF